MPYLQKTALKILLSIELLHALFAKNSSKILLSIELLAPMAVGGHALFAKKQL